VIVSLALRFARIDLSETRSKKTIRSFIASDGFELSTNRAVHNKKR